METIQGDAVNFRLLRHRCRGEFRAFRDYARIAIDKAAYSKLQLLPRRFERLLFLLLAAA